MKKSPLSTPGGQGGNFYRGRGRQRGYGHNQMRNNNDNYHRFPGPNNAGNYQFEGNMIPLETSSPTFYHNNRGNRRQPNERHNQRFSNTGISGSYNQGYNNHRNNFQANSGSPYTPQKFQRNKQFRPNDPYSHRKIPISEFVDLKSMFEDPWAELMADLKKKRNVQEATTVANDSSIEIICEKYPREDSSSASTSDGATINISSSYEVKEGSSVDLPLESMNFNQSKDSSILSGDVTSQDDESFSEKANQSEDSSVIMLN
ncbi:epsin [Nasonia vitripennis]|uniref:Uncharacterized protein n=1 Tax=Nasonia vitripennis TaxID=7425 RepID=A0A7M7GCK1_NASVI|nr:epsin [Nasonia vitripennis]